MPTRPSARRGAGGLTLVELLVVLTIIAIAAGVVLPHAGGSMSSLRLRQAALTLAEHVRFAQALAVDRERPARLQIERAARRYRTELADNMLGLEFHPAPGIAGPAVSLPEKVEFQEIQFAFSPDGMEDTLLFDPLGQWTSGQMVLTDGTSRYLVRIRAGLGQVEVVRMRPGQQTVAEPDYGDLLEPAP